MGQFRSTTLRPAPKSAWLIVRIYLVVEAVAKWGDACSKGWGHIQRPAFWLTGRNAHFFQNLDAGGRGVVLTDEFIAQIGTPPSPTSCQTCTAYTEKGHGIAVAPLHIQTNYFLQLAVDLACASVDLSWAIFDDARACSDSFRPSSFLDAPCFAAALVW